jgi:hypothetical protein
MAIGWETCVRLEAVLTVMRDVVSMAVGSFIAVNEELSGQVHPELLLFAAALVGGPSMAALLSLARSAGRHETPGTPESSPRSVSPSPPS